eukprot:2135317-Lingulodinium_polyedra.AAC.1
MPVMRLQRPGGSRRPLQRLHQPLRQRIAQRGRVAAVGRAEEASCCCAADNGLMRVTAIATPRQHWHHPAIRDHDLRGLARLPTEHALVRPHHARTKMGED